MCFQGIERRHTTDPGKQEDGQRSTKCVHFSSFKTTDIHINHTHQISHFSKKNSVTLAHEEGGGFLGWKRVQNRKTVPVGVVHGLVWTLTPKERKTTKKTKAFKKNILQRSQFLFLFKNQRKVARLSPPQPGFANWFPNFISVPTGTL